MFGLRACDRYGSPSRPVCLGYISIGTVRVIRVRDRVGVMGSGSSSGTGRGKGTALHPAQCVLLPCDLFLQRGYLTVTGGLGEPLRRWGILHAMMVHPTCGDRAPCMQLWGAVRAAIGHPACGYLGNHRFLLQHPFFSGDPGVLQLTQTRPQLGYGFRAGELRP